MLKLSRLISIALLLMLLFSIAGLSGCSTVQGITEQDKQTIINTAVSYQTQDGVYSADSYEVVKLNKGDTIYGMLPGQSVFYINQSTVDEGKGSYKTLYNLLQIRPHPIYGYRTKLGKYEVLTDIYVAAGKCLANKTITIDGKTETLGNGGGFQYVVMDYQSILKMLEESDLHE
jgi:hypothetical protein